ncbi:hypothetical protein ASPVEDRAFT_352680 [Aspergillus versicolor CBS 583.65]|uniref:Uncharacterized protein n=1 Tax=Aspergillus versicolor CBS 583.65 TaxID=1036611 RepID=A0A1L9PZR0_ASPVE|nr:uncharacterized protein ASPVEDRAFT_352680 [Aspergillus versicolor CBS 583.65]OJJ06997.1 hypothetical protein ASPVEDRAFT_352680 [Aspergillus versicolor CBS 583.65]
MARRRRRSFKLIQMLPSTIPVSRYPPQPRSTSQHRKPPYPRRHLRPKAQVAANHEGTTLVQSLSKIRPPNRATYMSTIQTANKPCDPTSQDAQNSARTSKQQTK